MSFAVVFDTGRGEPLFAGIEDSTLFASTIPAVTPSLDQACRFETWEQAEQFLNGEFGARFAACGAVVEVDE